MTSIYNIVIAVYYSLLRMLALAKHPRADKWVKGRKEQKQIDLPELLSNYSRIWFHMSSAGEFEQAIPYIKELKLQSRVQVIGTFFSPSGYEMHKKNELLDAVFYSPVDSPASVKKFITSMCPDVLIIIKNELWYNMINQCYTRGIPIYILNYEYKRSFPIWDNFKNKMLLMANTVYLSHGHSNLPNLKSASDSKLERVLQVKNEPFSVSGLEQFSDSRFTIILGSSYDFEEDLIFDLLKHDQEYQKKLRIIIAPHEVTEFRFNQIITKSPVEVHRYSTGIGDSSIILLDEPGVLKYIYRYGQLAIIGGAGSKNKVHSVMEAAVYGIPIAFGPHYLNDSYATKLVDIGLDCVFRNSADLKRVIDHLISAESVEEFKLAFNHRIENSKRGNSTSEIIREIREGHLQTRIPERD